MPLSQALPNGAVACCETCGALNNEGVPGCLADEVAGDFNNFFHLLVLLINLFIFTSAELAPAQPPGNLFPSRDIR